MNNLVFLTQLTHLWRSELCRYAKSMDPFVLPNHSEVYQPACMTSKNDRKSFSSSGATWWMKWCTCKVWQLEGSSSLKHSSTSRSKRPRPTLRQTKTAAPRKAKSKVDKKKSPCSDTGDALCVANLLNHCGSNQQIACAVPCPYPHYTVMTSHSCASPSRTN